MANKEYSTVYQSKDFCNKASAYCLYCRLFRQMNIVTIVDTDCKVEYFHYST